MFALRSDITIGQFVGVKPHSVKVNKSIHQYCDRALITIPITARIVRAGVVITQSAETAKTITEGMKVSIKLGYNNTYNDEFEGFVARVNLTTPCEIECEGYSYQLRKQTYLKTFKNTTLLAVLQFLVIGTDIVVDTQNIPHFPIDKIAFSNNSGTECLELIKKKSENTISIYFTKNIIFAGLVGLPVKATTKYQLGWNVIKDGQLKQRLAANQDVTVHFINEQKDGTKKLVTSGNKSKLVSNVITTTGSAGEKGEVKVIKTHWTSDSTSLQMQADAKHQQLSYDGYEGKITAFLLPYCEPGYKSVIDDQKYVERSGNYFTEATEVTYNKGGARRIVDIGIKL